MPVNGADGMETVIREHLSDFDTVMNVPAEARDLAQALREAEYGDVAAAKGEALEHGRVGWRLHGELVEKSNRERLHLGAVIDELKSLLRRACEADAREDCHLDHNGGCQAHGFLSEPCPYPLIRQYLVNADRDQIEADR